MDQVRIAVTDTGIGISVTAPAAVPAVRAGGCVDHAPLRRRGPRPGDLPPARGTDGRGNRGRERAGQWVDILVQVAGGCGCPSVSEGDRPVLRALAVLVVDAHDQVRNLLQRDLRQLGVRADGARSGSEALARLRDRESGGSFDVLIVGYLGSGDESRQLVEQLRTAGTAGGPALVAYGNGSVPGCLAVIPRPCVIAAPLVAALAKATGVREAALLDLPGARCLWPAPGLVACCWSTTMRPMPCWACACWRSSAARSRSA